MPSTDGRPSGGSTGHSTHARDASLSYPLLWVHGISPRWLASVLPGMQRRFFFACLGVGVIAVAVSLGVQALVPGDATGSTGPERMPTGQLLATAVVILLTTPLQALGRTTAFAGT